MAVGLDRLPNELLLMVAGHIESVDALNALSICCRTLHRVFEPILRLRAMDGAFSFRFSNRGYSLGIGNRAIFSSRIYYILVAIRLGHPALSWMLDHWECVDELDYKDGMYYAHVRLWI